MRLMISGLSSRSSSSTRSANLAVLPLEFIRRPGWALSDWAAAGSAKHAAPHPLQNLAVCGHLGAPHSGQNLGICSTGTSSAVAEVSAPLVAPAVAPEAEVLEATELSRVPVLEGCEEDRAEEEAELACDEPRLALLASRSA